MTIHDAVQFLDANTPNKTIGLPDDIFYFISRTTPLVNVDLLVKDKEGRVLLTWRDDEYYGKGWHVPGGIIRFKETLEQRIHKTALSELGTDVSFDPEPLTIEQSIMPGWENRAHFISFLYRCYVPNGFMLDNKSKERYDTGYMQWHDKSPVDLIDVHERYKRFIDLVDIGDSYGK